MLVDLLITPKVRSFSVKLWETNAGQAAEMDGILHTGIELVVSWYGTLKLPTDVHKPDVKMKNSGTE